MNRDLLSVRYLHKGEFIEHDEVWAGGGEELQLQQVAPREEVEETHRGAQGVQECRVAEVLVAGRRLAEALLQEKFTQRRSEETGKVGWNAKTNLKY